MIINLHVLVSVLLSLSMVKSQVYMEPEPKSCEGCDRKYTYRSSRTDIFTSPQFPENYPERTKCCYFFQAKENGRVRIEFDYFNLESSAESCRYDYIEISNINDGGYREEPHQRYCGKTKPPVYISKYSILEIVFKSDVTTNEKGFLGHYEFLDTNWHPFPPTTIGCGAGYQTGPGGVIQSPNYPNNYPSEAGCAWIIQAKPSQRILLTIVYLDISDNENCQNTNMLMILEGFSLPDSDSVRYCRLLESGEKIEHLSKGDRLVLRFESMGNYGNKQGFSLTWSAVTLVEDGGCDGFQCAEAGTEVCERQLGEDICNYRYFCMDDKLRCNEQPNCGKSDYSDENKCLNYIMRYVGYIGGSTVVVIIIVIISVVCCYKKRQKERLKYSVPADHSATQSMNTFISTQSSNLPVRSLEHSPRSSCVMYTTSFTDCVLPDTVSSTSNHSNKPTFHSFTNNSSTPHPVNSTHDTSNTDHTKDDTENPTNTDTIDSSTYKGHQKRPSYHMMRELYYDDGNLVLADI